jgi:hypothetical protein
MPSRRSEKRRPPYPLTYPLSGADLSRSRPACTCLPGCENSTSSEFMATSNHQMRSISGSICYLSHCHTICMRILHERVFPHTACANGARAATWAGAHFVLPSYSVRVVGILGTSTVRVLVRFLCAMSALRRYSRGIGCGDR